jgi:hypothetical protein
MNKTKTLASSITTLTLACGLAIACSEDQPAGDGAASGGSAADSGGASSGGNGSGAVTGGASAGGTASGGVTSGGTTTGGAPATGGDLVGGGTGGLYPPFGYGGLPFGGAPPFGEQECPADKPEVGSTCTPGFPVLGCPFGSEVCKCPFDVAQGPGATLAWECGVPEPLADCGSDVNGSDGTLGDECTHAGLTCACQPQWSESGPVFQFLCS